MKKIITTLLSFSLLTSAAYAQFTVNEPSKDLETQIITISGTNTDADLKDTLNIFVTNPGYSFEDVKNGTTDALQQFATVKYNSDGSFSFSFENNTPKNVGDRWYKCYVTGDGIEVPVEKTYYFASTGDMKKQLEDINEKAYNMTGTEPTEEELNGFNTLIVQAENMFSLKDAFYTAVITKNVSKNLMLYIKDNQLDVTDFKGFTSLVKLFSIIECFNEGKESLVFENGEIKNTDLLGIDTFDADKNVTFVSLYKNSVNDTGKAKILSSLLNKNLKNKEEFLKAFGESVTVNAIKYAKTGGSGHITNVLTAGNTAFVEMNVSGYVASQNKDYYNSVILNSAFENVSQLETVVNTAVSTPIQIPGNTIVSGIGSNTSGGGFSYSGGGSASSSTDYIEDIDKNSKTMNFEDVTAEHWAYESVKALFLDDVISGTSEKTFSPDDYVTREQITKMLVRAFNVTTNMELTSFKFADVDKDSWYYSYVVTAKNEGIVNGISENTFGIGQYVTRQDISAMIYRIAGDKLKISEKEIDFTDSDNISDYARDSVGALYKAGIISGFEDGSFKPAGNCTRAQAATIIYNTLKNIGGAE